MTQTGAVQLTTTQAAPPPPVAAVPASVTATEISTRLQASGAPPSAQASAIAQVPEASVQAAYQKISTDGDAKPVPTLTGSKASGLEETPKQVLIEILQSTNLSSAKVTSLSRDAAGQAQAMYDLIKSDGLQAAYDLYGSSGDKVLDVYKDETAKEPAPSEAAIVAAMKTKIDNLGASTVSNHCSDTYYVVDIGRSSIPAGDVATFVANAEANPKVAKVILEQNCVHIEINK